MYYLVPCMASVLARSCGGVLQHIPVTWYLVPGTLPLVRYLVPGIEYHGLCANKYIPGTLVPFIANM